MKTLTYKMSYINPLSVSVALLWKPVNWFAQQDEGNTGT